MAVAARTGYEGQERGTGYDRHAGQDVRVFPFAKVHSRTERPPLWSNRFVDRYIPGYLFFGDGVTEGVVDEQGKRTLPPWQGQGLALELDQERRLMSTRRF